VAAYDLLIFDFDGTLVPTEELANRLMQPLLADHLDVHLSDEQMVEHFRGRDLPTQFSTIEGFYGAPVPQTFLDAMEARWTHAVKNELAPSQGAVEALEALKGIPRIIASNGYRDGIEMALESTGLNKYFDDFICAEDVENPKPAPDMFLEAAARFDTDVRRCLVVEDSVLGTLAAITAKRQIKRSRTHRGRSTSDSPLPRVAAVGIHVTDDEAMALALEAAGRAAAAGDVPVGAVIVRGDDVLAVGFNKKEALQEPTAHAEVLAIREAVAKVGSWRLLDTTLVVTLEPCIMCAGAIVAARIPRVVFGAYDPKAGATGSLYNVCVDPRLNHQSELVGGVQEQECSEILRSFFVERRGGGAPTEL
jgi:tRNA(adenine34) deaminase